MQLFYGEFRNQDLPQEENIKIIDTLMDNYNKRYIDKHVDYGLDF